MADTILIITTIMVLIPTILIMGIYASRYKKVAPDMAMVVYGRQMHPGVRIGYRVIIGGGKFIIPVIEDVKYMDVGLKKVNLELDNMRTDPTKGASPVRINLTALYKISDEPSALNVACENLLDKTGEDVKSMVESIRKGHVRGIAATMTPREIDMNRDEVEDKLRASAWKELLNTGIEIKALAIVRVHHKGGM